VNRICQRSLKGRAGHLQFLGSCAGFEITHVGKGSRMSGLSFRNTFLKSGLNKDHDRVADMDGVPLIVKKTFDPPSR
jgi:hypothetical protein